MKSCIIINTRTHHVTLFYYLINLTIYKGFIFCNHFRFLLFIKNKAPADIKSTGAIIFLSYVKGFSYSYHCYPLR